MIVACFMVLFAVPVWANSSSFSQIGATLHNYRTAKQLFLSTFVRAEQQAQSIFREASAGVKDDMMQFSSAQIGEQSPAGQTYNGQVSTNFESSFSHGYFEAVDSGPLTFTVSSDLTCGNGACVYDISGTASLTGSIFGKLSCDDPNCAGGGFECIILGSYSSAQAMVSGVFVVNGSLSSSGYGTVTAGTALVGVSPSTATGGGENSCVYGNGEHSSSGNFSVSSFGEIVNGVILESGSATSYTLVYPLIMGSTTTTLSLYQTDFTTVSCHPYTQLVSRTVDCEASVTGNYPSGTVTFTASLPKGKTLGPNTCSLNEGLPATQSTESCWYQIKTNLNGTVQIQAQYSGDSSNPPSSGGTTIKFVFGHSHLKVTCSPSIVNGTLSATCVARVTGTVTGVPPPIPIPEGNITWTDQSNIGVFSNSTCILVNSVCQVEYYQGNASVPATIVATYSGDLLYPPKRSTITLVPLYNGAACADQRQYSGFKICLKGAAGTTANITSTNYLSQPNGTGNAPFADAEYYDINVGGVVGGDAQICYYGPEVNATTSMNYYYNGAWNAASNVDVTAGVSVCGSIPVSALSGTPLAIGGENTQTSSSSTTSKSSSSASENTTKYCGNCSPLNTSVVVASAVVTTTAIGVAVYLRRRKS